MWNLLQSAALKDYKIKKKEKEKYKPGKICFEKK